MSSTKYMPKEDLVPIVDKWLQREGLADDVEFLHEAGGMDWLKDGLNTNLEFGIDKASVEERRMVFGTNMPDEVIPKTIMQLFWEALQDLTLIVLIIAAILSIVINMATEEHKSIAWIEGFAILCAVFLSAFVQAVNDYQKEKQFQDLNKEAEANKRVNVIRNGTSEGVKLGEVVSGDVIEIISGMEVPGDGIVIEGFNVQADESAMTGEVEPIHKESIMKCHQKMKQIIDEGMANKCDSHEVPTPIMVSGTKIQNGTGKMLIFLVGKDSSIGKIRDTMDSNKDEVTPLQAKLEKIAEDIGKFGLVSAVCTLVILLIRVFIDYGGRKKWTNADTGACVNGVLVAITVLVVAIPEGLPLAVTLSLAFSVKKMLADKNLVRKLHACETMGGANIICSDKTGTLTRNEMFLTHYWNNESYDLYNSTENSTTPYSDWINKSVQNIFEENIACNSLADPIKNEGQATELATVKYLFNCGINCLEFKKKFKVVHMETFSSDRKRMSTIIEMDNGQHRLYTKGASEYILEATNKMLDLNSGNISDITQDNRKSAEQAIESFARKSLRTIGMAYVDLAPGSYDVEDKDAKKCMKIETSGLTLIGICGIKDIIRAEVPGSVLRCNRAGISVKMVTGDNKTTARAIAQEVNILDDNDEEDRVMQGPDFLKLIGGVVCFHCKWDKTKDVKKCDCVKNAAELKKPENKGKNIKQDTILNGEEFDKIWQRLAVLARSRPEDKYALVVGLRERGNVVAVTGDGTNDAPALSKADVGFAMGIAGTEVAKQAAAIMLMDDDFTSIVSAVKWGRNIYDSIRKFLVFQLTVNCVAVLVTFISAATTKEAILSAIQMLWINLIMDTLASLALATEPPTDKLLERMPHRRDSYIVSVKMGKHIIGQAIYQTIVMMIFYFMGEKFLWEEIDDEQKQVDSNLVVSGLEVMGYDEKSLGPSRHFTYNFNVFVMMQIFNFLNARKLQDEMNVFEGMKVTSIFSIIVLMIFLLQLGILTFGNVAFRCCPWGLGWSGWLFTIAIGSGSIFVSMLLKLIPEEKCCGAEEHAVNLTVQTGDIKADEHKSSNRVNSLSIRRLGGKDGNYGPRGSGKGSNHGSQNSNHSKGNENN